LGPTGEARSSRHFGGLKIHSASSRSAAIRTIAPVGSY
jgi:hypothetical protein